MTIETLRMEGVGITGAGVLESLRPGMGIKTRLRRMGRLIENGDWDERVLKMEGRIDFLCWVAILAFIICLLPAFFKAWI